MSCVSCLTPLTSFLQSTKRIGQGEILRGESQLLPVGQGLSPRRGLSIHILDDDSLLNVFHLYRPAISGGDEHDIGRIMGAADWRWWYKLAHVCRRWRNLTLGSASYLRLCLVCTHGTPVADMLAHSPPLPLVIDYLQGTTGGDVDGMILALKRRDRVRCIRFRPARVRHQQNIFVTINDEYPALEYLTMGASSKVEGMALMLPETFQAPHLRQLTLSGFALPMGSRLPTFVGLVTLNLLVGNLSSYFQPNVLLDWLSSMPQLESLLIVISYWVIDTDLEKQLMHTPILTSATLPSLRYFEFKGSSAYMEAIIRWITTPRLEKLGMEFKQLIFSVPSLLFFMNTSENLRFDSAKFKFSNFQIDLEFYRREEAEVYPLSMTVNCWDILSDRQITSVAPLLHSFGQMSQIFSTVEHLTLEHEKSFKLEERHEVDRAEWRELIRSFRNVKTLRVDEGIVKELSRGLRKDDGNLPLELLPMLQELRCSGSGDTGDTFTPFIDTRQNAGPVQPSP